MKTAAIIGAGLTGCVIAEQLHAHGVAVTILEKEDTVGGLCRDAYTREGLLIALYGAHIFHTNDRMVWDYMSRFTQWRPYVHHVWAYVRGSYVPVPINAATLDILGCDAQTAHVLVYDDYTRKMWGPWAEEVAAETQKRVPVRMTTDGRWFTDRWQGMPAQGYVPLFERMLAGVDVQCGVEINIVDELLRAHDIVVNTGRLDALCGFSIGALTFRSLHMEPVTSHMEYQQPYAVVNFPETRYPYIRAVEHKRLTGQCHYKTTVTYETPFTCSRVDTPTHPVPTRVNRVRNANYAQQLPPELFVIGRFPEMRYLDMGATVRNAMDAVPHILQDA